MLFWKIVLFATIISVLPIISCEENLDPYPTVSREITSEYLLNGNLTVYLQNEQIVRQKGKPGTSVIQIGMDNLSDYEECFILKVASGAESIGIVSSAIIKLDGQEVLNPSDFSNSEIVYQFEICNLSQQSVLEVEVRGTPGSYLDIWIEGKLKEATVTDIDGNSYKTVRIGDQWWMAENLKATKFKDGTPIPLVTDKTEWCGLTTPGYCWYNNDPNNKSVYGALYNYYTVQTGKLCPDGWHLPTSDEWHTLTIYLGGLSEAGGKLKETGTIHWANPNTGATNESGFTGLPGGFRSQVNGVYYWINLSGEWWEIGSSSPPNETSLIFVEYDNSEIGRGYPSPHDAAKKRGVCVRCIKD